MTVRFGVLGACGIAERRTIHEGIVKAKNAELVAIMDIQKEKVRKLAEKYDVRYYTREEDLLSDRDVDAVYISTPVYLHYQHVITAATKGKHILCEKSMANTVEECEEMISTCKKNGVKLSVGFMMRNNVYHKRIKEMLDSGELGKPVMGRAQLSCWYPEIEGAWRQNPELGGGGSLIDMGSHCIDLLEMFFGKTVKVSAFTRTSAFNYEVEDTAVVILEFEKGALGIVDNCFNIPDSSSKNMLEVYGTKGSIIANGTIGQQAGGDVIACIEKDTKGYEAEQVREEAGEEKIVLTPQNTYQQEIEDFCEAIESDKEPLFTGEDGLWNQKVILAAYESSKSGKVVELG